MGVGAEAACPCWAGTAEIVSFLAKEVSKDTYVNIMDQYRPCYRAQQFPSLNRLITAEEYARAVDEAREVGLHRFDERRPRFLRTL